MSRDGQGQALPLQTSARPAFSLARVLALRAPVERQAEPEFPEDCERDEGGYDRDELRLRHLAHDDVHVAAEAERERDERRDQNLRGEAVEVLRLLAALDDSVVGRGRHQKHNSQCRQADAREVHVLRQARQTVEALRQDGYELEAHQSLRGRQNDAALRQHVLDLVAQLLLCGLLLVPLLPGLLLFHLRLLPQLLDLVGALAPAVQLKQIPEKERDQCAQQSDRCSRLPTDYLLRRHVQIDAEAEREGLQCETHQLRRVAVYLLRVLAALDDAVVGRGRDEEADGDEQQPLPDESQELRRQRKRVEALLEEGAELQAGEHLRADDEHARLVERVLDLIFEFRHVRNYEVGTLSYELKTTAFQFIVQRSDFIVF